jgi:hypothetical protein
MWVLTTLLVLNETGSPKEPMRLASSKSSTNELPIDKQKHHKVHIKKSVHIYKGKEERILSCIHQPIQPKSLSWWGKVDNSLILQHSPSRAGSPRPHTWILEWAVIILINAPARIRTRDLWPWYHIELHTPTNSTQKLKLMRKGGQFTYTQTKNILIFLSQTLCVGNIEL